MKATVELEVVHMAKTPKKADDKQVTFRLPADLHAALECTAGKLGYDISGLLRNMLLRHLPEYKTMAEDIDAKWKEWKECGDA